MQKLISAPLLATAAACAVIAAPPANADQLPAGCVSQFWMYGGLLGRGTTRYICDDPVQADGSWMRTRLFYAPAYVANATSSCYSSTWSSNCTYYPAHQVDEFVVKDIYRVAPDAILPDEPGHID